jgi:hypothetical protein
VSIIENVATVAEICEGLFPLLIGMLSWRVIPWQNDLYVIWRVMENGKGVRGL